MPRVSVVVRTSNSGETLTRVLDGIQAQDFDDYELIVVDSGSTDGTLERIGQYPHVFVDYSGETFSYSGSLNAGCAAARGEYVVCLSHHCIPLHSGWMRALVEAMDGNGRLAGAWGPLVFDTGEYLVGRREVRVMELDEFYRRPNQGLQNPNAIIRRVLWEKRPFSEEVRRCEDQDWIHHHMKLGFVSAMVYDAQVLYAPVFGYYQYAASTYKNLLALNDMFGFRTELSTLELLRGSVRTSGAAVLGKRAPRVSGLAVAGMVGRWAADKTIRYGIESGRARLKGRTNTELRDGLRRGKASVAKALTKLREEAPRAGALRRRLAASPAYRPTAGTTSRFFLVGEMRSGTSWLSRTLSSHPEVFCKGEGSFFGREQRVEEIPVYKGRTPSLHNALAECDGLRAWRSFTWNAWARGREEEDALALTRLAVDYFMDKDAAGSGKRIVGDKSPLHTDHVDEIYRIYPEAKVIHIHRDGRDVAVSLMHHFWRLSRDKGGIFDLEPEELARRDAYLEDPEGYLVSGESIFSEERLRQMATRWSRRVSHASSNGRNLFGPAFYQLGYEDLLTTPEERLAEIFALLGASSDEATVLRCIEKNRFEKLAGRREGQEDASSFFRKGVAGEWKSVFTEGDRKIYEAVAGATLREMGYPLD